MALAHITIVEVASLLIALVGFALIRWMFQGR
jgi:hypothetical protein